MPKDAGETVEGGIGGMQEGVFPEVAGSDGMAGSAEGGFHDAGAFAVEIDAQVEGFGMDLKGKLVVSLHVVEGGDMELFGVLCLPSVGCGVLEFG